MFDAGPGHCLRWLGLYFRNAHCFPLLSRLGRSKLSQSPGKPRACGNIRNYPPQDSHTKRQIRVGPEGGPLWDTSIQSQPVVEAPIVFSSFHNILFFKLNVLSHQISSLGQITWRVFPGVRLTCIGSYCLVFIRWHQTKNNKCIASLRFVKSLIREPSFFLSVKSRGESTNMACSLGLFEPRSWWMISRNNVPVTLNHIKTWLIFNFSYLICKNFHLICSGGHWNSIIKRIKISGIICSERDIKSRKCWIFLLTEQWEMALSAGT